MFSGAKRRSLERRLSHAKLGRFKPLTEFDWQWPDKIDQKAIHALMQLDFLTGANNLILLGGNGVGKSTLTQNLGYQAVMRGHTVLFTTAPTCSMTWPPWTVTTPCGEESSTTPNRLC
ncbi:MAG: ATP-binding protein [Methylicorpusculum sp.]|uniref:ATP-binding protein n=1 Tax=Methylicorpusculum sp. TaxID=2713644 RepID=UPI00272281A4|nr:ATP-binding protein [Methylicorpusculum sp.]MDO8941113.1 ATP-binding protein [Methylicorpusculum sp.]MDO9239049.1 ATP-binding protein [Methylicorpusculum sp.]MDP2201119.1 ATP-binding protein [Methylicorpusculum sp.]MDP3530870.1 ATP-binding protein [Methylicorpusculum sp.]MDZ4149700.1 ATP-binding protein [Methylicorpusculum sp.]